MNHRILKVLCCVCCVYCLTLCLPSLLYNADNADNESGAETHQILLLLIMRSYANIGAAPRVNPDNCRVQGYTVTKGGKYSHREITIYFDFLFPKKN